MNTFNIFLILGSAIIPMLVGAIYYHPKVVGNAWMKATGMTDEKIASGNIAVTFGVSFILSALLALALSRWSIHQLHVESLFAMQPGFAETGNVFNQFYQNFLAKYGTMHRTFGHGVAHGILGSICFALPLVGVNAMFEQRGFKYILIHFGYWLITICLMCGILCQFYRY